MNNQIWICGKITDKTKVGADGKFRRLRLEIRKNGKWIFAQVIDTELVERVDRLSVGDMIEGTGKVDLFHGKRQEGQSKSMMEIVLKTIKKSAEYLPGAEWKLIGEITGDRVTAFTKHRNGMDMTFSVVVEGKSHGEKIYPVLIVNRRDVVRYVENTFEAGSRVAITGTIGKYRNTDGIWLPCMVARKITFACMEGD